MELNVNIFAYGELTKNEQRIESHLLYEMEILHNT